MLHPRLLPIHPAAFFTPKRQPENRKTSTISPFSRTHHPMPSVTLFTLFLLGFFGGTHCIAMCGGLSTAFALQLPPHIKRPWLIILLNLGRLTSYTLIGTLMGALSQLGSTLAHIHALQLILATLANLLLLFTGLYLANILAWAAKIEHIGRPIWQRLNPLLNKLLPIQSLPACFGAGMLWGWLPCGLVYNASLYALGSSSALWGGLYLLAFGLGTLPNLIAAGLFASQLRALLQKKWLRRMAGLLVSVWAVIQLARVVVQF